MSKMTRALAVVALAAVTVLTPAVASAAPAKAGASVTAPTRTVSPLTWGWGG